MPATDDDIRLTSIMAAPATPQGMPVSIDCNTQRVDDPQVTISRPVISVPATSHQLLDTPSSFKPGSV